MKRRYVIASFVAALLILRMVLILSFYPYQKFESSIEGPASGFERYVQSLYESIELKKAGLDFDCFRYAIVGYFNLKRQGAIAKEGIISIIDYRKPCNDKRFYVINLREQTLLYHALVAHGRHSGDIYARHFSNTPRSLQSSLGFFVTGNTYDGEYGYSLYLYGMDEGFNDNARSRGIVVHGAYYVRDSFLAQYGKIGKSQGCPALPAGLHIDIIDTIMGGTCLFQFYNDSNYLKGSSLLDVGNAASQLKKEYSP